MKVKKKFFTRQLAMVLVIAILFTMFPTNVEAAGNPVTHASYDDGLIAHWNLNEGSGTVAHDVTGNGYDAVIQRPAWVDGPTGKALNFNGQSFNSNNNCVVELPMSVFDKTENGVTISMLVWVEDTEDRLNTLYSAGKQEWEHMVMMATSPKWDGGRSTGQRMSMRMELNDAQVMSDRDSRKEGKHTTPEKEWALLTYTQEDDKATLYVNGEMVSQHNEYVYRIKDLGKKPGSWDYLQFNKWLVGVNQPYGGDEGLLGKVADIRVYDRALSAMELEDLSNLDLVTKYEFLDTNNDVVYDSSLYGFNGTKNAGVTISGGEAGFNGSGKITVNPAVFDLANEDMTVTAYVNVIDLANSGTLLSIGSAADRLWSLSGDAEVNITTPEMLKRLVAPSSSLTSAVWGQITYVQEGKSARLFIDGEMVAHSEVINPVSWYAQGGDAVIGGGTYGSPAFNGGIAEFRIYKRALNVDEIRRVGDLAAIKCTMKSIAFLQNDVYADVNGGVTDNLKLFSKAENHGVKILWESNRTNLIAPDGTVTRPNAGRILVNMTASITKNGITIIRRFPIIVKGVNEKGMILHYDFSEIKGINNNNEGGYMGVTIPDVTGNDMEGVFRVHRPLGSLDDGGWDRMHYIPGGGVAGDALSLGHSTVTIDDEVLAAARRDGGAISFAFRIYPRDLGDWWGMLGIGSSNRDYFLIQPRNGVAGNGVRVGVGHELEQKAIDSPSSLPLNQWVNIVVTHDGNSTMKLYVNGAPVGSRSDARSPTSVIVPSRNFFVLGNGSNIKGWGDPWPLINYDDFRIYNYDLSASEAANMGNTMTNDWNSKVTSLNNTSCDLTSLSINGTAGKIYNKNNGSDTFNNIANNNEVYVVVPKGTNLKAVNLAATAVAGATVSPMGTVDFSESQKRVVTVKNGGQSKNYIVHVEVANGYEWPDEQALPSFSELAPTLEAFKSHNIHSYNENEVRGVIASLQGLVNYNQPRIILQDGEAGGWDGIGDSADRWLIDTNINFTKTKDWIQLLWKYRYTINCVVPYTSNGSTGTGGQNIATTIAGIEGGIQVEKNSKIYKILTGAPFYIQDYTDPAYTPKVTTAANKAAYTPTVQGYGDTSANRVDAINFISNNLYTYLNNRVVSSLAHEHAKARDFSVATKSAVIWAMSGNSSELSAQRSALNGLVGSSKLNMPSGKGVFIGFWPDEGQGVAFGTNGSALGTQTTAGPGGLATVPMDFFENYTVYSGQSREVNPAPIPKKPDYSSSHYYISMYMSEGDNLQYNQGSQRERGRIGARETYEYPYTWTISPALLDAAPQILNWYYETATWGLDTYVSGPSGLGYLKANNFPTANTAYVNTLAQRSNYYFERTNLRIATMWDSFSSTNASTTGYLQNFPYALGFTTQSSQGNTNLNWNSTYNNVPFIWFGLRTRSLTSSLSIGNRPMSYNGGDISDWDSATNNNQRREPASYMAYNQGGSGTNNGFAAVQFVTWKSMPDRIKYDFIGLNRDGTSAGSWGLESKSSSFKTNYRVVRGDHQMMLINEKNNKPINVALQKKSSASAFDYEHEPSMAFDGSNGRIYSWQSSEPGDKWVQVDLSDDNTPRGRRFNISKYVVQNAGISAAYDSSLNTAEWIFQTSTDGINWIDVETVTANTQDIVYRNVTGTGTQNVRYARLYIPAGKEGRDGVARILDLEVHAIPGTVMTQETGTTALNNLINTSLVEDEYTDASWAEYIASKTEAQTLADNGSRTEKQMDDAMYNLAEAINNLDTDNTELEKAIAISLPYEEPDWSVASWAAFETALADAWTVYEDSDATQKEIDDATAELLLRKSQLTTDKTALNTAIGTAGSKTESDYAPASWAAMQTALTTANTVYADPDVVQSVIDSTTLALNNAIDGLTTDKTALNTVITLAGTKTESEYSAASWTAMQTALSEANTVYADPDAVQSEINAKETALSAAITALTTDKTALGTAITLAESKTESDYTPASWAAMQTALSEANTVNNNVSALQSEINAKETALSAAILALTTDKTALNTAISTAGTKTESDYSSASWTAMQTALTEANTVYADSSAVQSEINAKEAALNVAITALTTDKTALNSAIVLSSTKIESDYSPASWAAMQTALTEANTVYADSSAVQSVIDAKETALNSAIVALTTDKTALDANIVVAEGKTEGEYSPTTWANLQSMKQAATDISQSATAKQWEINLANVNLLAAINGLAIDKSVLATTIGTASGKLQSDYSPASWTAFNTALIAANTVFSDLGANQMDVDLANNNLSIAMGNLTTDKTALSTAIGVAGSKTATDYSPASWGAMQTALAEANTVYADSSAVQSEINAKETALNSAIAALTTDKTALSTAIATAGSKTESDYSPASWTAMQIALTEANTVNSDTSAVQSEIDAKKTALNSAIAALTTDKTALSTAIATAGGKTESDYSPASWAAMQTALTEANTVNADTSAVQSEINAKETALNSAIAALTTDKTALDTAIATAGSKTESDYSPASWTAMQTALAEANTVNGNASAVQSEIDEKETALNNAIDALTTDNTALEETIALAESKKESDYSVASWADMKVALESANTINSKADVKQSELNEIQVVLANAIAALTVDKTELDKEIVAIEKLQLNSEDYTAESWNAFAEVLGKAKKALTDANCPQSEVDELLEQLTLVKGRLVEVQDTAPPTGETIPYAEMIAVIFTSVSGLVFAKKRHKKAK